jgi:TolB-like protein/DNA-binding winged helix-turn-helix (wHTH) protein/Flp pilus assembly protein TadD
MSVAESKIKQLDESPFTIGEWHVDPSLGRIRSHKSISDSTKLEPQVMAVLLCLAKQPNQVISREYIEEQAWPDRVVGYDSLSTAIIKLRKALNDDSKNPRYIETVPKKGYRLITKVSVSEISKHSTSEEKKGIDISYKFRGQRLQLMIVLGIVIASFAFILYEKLPYLFSIVQLDKNNTIAVLPFENMSKDIQQEYFSDGITSDLITDLSKISGLSVIARNSVFVYKKSSTDVRQIGKELSAKYIVEGSVRKVKNKVRISARLIDATTGHNLWAERFDGDLDNVFVLQDDVTSKIISALELKISDQEKEQLVKKYTNSFEAYDHFLQGWNYFWLYSKESNILAKEQFKKAIEFDPRFARAYANLALSYAYDVSTGWTNTPEENLRYAKELSQKSIELDDGLSQVHWAVGYTALISREYQLALSEAQKVIDLDPNNADGYGLLAAVLNYAAKPKDALRYMQKAMNLNPLHPSVYKVIMGEIYFNLHDYNNAVKQFEHALIRNPEAQEPRIFLSASYAHLDRIDDANWQLEQIRGVDPEISITTIQPVIPFRDPMQLKHLINGLSKAGLK